MSLLFCFWLYVVVAVAMMMENHGEMLTGLLVALAGKMGNDDGMSRRCT